MRDHTSDERHEHLAESERGHEHVGLHRDDRDDDRAAVTRHEEELFVETRPVVSGRVRVSKRVVTEERTIRVRREELVVEEIPVGEGARDEIRDHTRTDAAGAAGGVAPQAVDRDWDRPEGKAQGLFPVDHSEHDVDPLRETDATRAANPAHEAAHAAGREHRGEEATTARLSSANAAPGEPVIDWVLHEEQVVTRVVPVERVRVVLDQVTREKVVEADLAKEVVTVEEVDVPRGRR